MKTMESNIETMGNNSGTIKNNIENMENNSEEIENNLENCTENPIATAENCLESDAENQEVKEKWTGLKGWIKDISIAILVALLIMTFIKPTIVQDRSMQSTLYENNYILLSRQAYLFSTPGAGDIVVFQSSLPGDGRGSHRGGKLLIKRVIAVAGDTVTIANGNVYVNGELQEEPFLNGKETPGALDNILVPKGTVFVMGDNRGQSTDSRHDSVSFVPVDDIVGRAFIRLLPFSQIGLL